MRILNFNKTIYHRDAVLGSIKAFSEVADLKFRETERSLVVFVRAENGLEREVEDELTNYALGLTKMKISQSAA